MSSFFDSLFAESPEPSLQSRYLAGSRRTQEVHNESEMDARGIYGVKGFKVVGTSPLGINNDKESRAHDG
jgi:hypothetical protein